MTDEERKQIVSDVLAALKQNSTTIDQMLEKENCADDDFFETNKGNKISFKTLSKGYNEEQGAVGDAVRYQLKRSDGKKLYPQTSSACVTMSDGDDSLDTRVKNITTEYNVSLFHPKQGIDGGNKYTLSSAIALVPEKYRSIGIKCSFIGEDGLDETWEWLGGSWSYYRFKKVGVNKFDDLSTHIDNIYNKLSSSEVYTDINVSWTNGKYLNPLNGTLNDSSSNASTSDYVEVANKKILLNTITTPNWALACFYDKDKNFIDSITCLYYGYSENVTDEFIITNHLLNKDIKYAKFTANRTQDNFELKYTDFKFVESVNDVSVESLLNKSYDYLSRDNYKIVNTEWTNGYYLDASGELQVTSSGASVSDYVDIRNKKVKCHSRGSSAWYICLYNEKKEIIKSLNMGIDFDVFRTSSTYYDYIITEHLSNPDIVYARFTCLRDTGDGELYIAENSIISSILGQTLPHLNKSVSKLLTGGRREFKSVATTFENGKYLEHTGELKDSVVGAKVSDYILVERKLIKVSTTTSPSWALACFYDKDKKIVGYIDCSKYPFFNSTEKIYDFYITEHLSNPDIIYARFTLSKELVCDIQLVDSDIIENVEGVELMSLLKNTYNLLSKDEYSKINTTWTDGKYLNWAGVETESQLAAISDFVDVTSKKIKIVTNTASIWALAVLYDKDKNKIGVINNTVLGVPDSKATASLDKEYIITSPLFNSKIKYARFTVAKGNKDSVYIADNEIRDSINGIKFSDFLNGVYNLLSSNMWSSPSVSFTDSKYLDSSGNLQDSSTGARVSDFIDVSNLKGLKVNTITSENWKFIFYDANQNIVLVLNNLSFGISNEEATKESRTYDFTEYLNIFNNNRIGVTYARFTVSKDGYISILNNKLMDSLPISTDTIESNVHYENIRHLGYLANPSIYEADICYIPMYGQSYTVANDGGYKLTTKFDDNCYMHGDTDPLSAGGTTLKPLNTSNDKEFTVADFADVFSKILKRFFRKQDILVQSYGEGSRSVLELQKDNGYENSAYHTFETKLIPGITNAVQAVTNAEKTIVCPFFLYLQGESDVVTWRTTGATTTSQCNGDKNMFKAELIKLKNQVQELIMEKTKQSVRPLMIMYNPGNQNFNAIKCGVSQAVVELVSENEDIFSIGPYYHMPSMGAHCSPDGRRWLAEKFADIAINIQMKAEYPYLTAKSARISGKKLILSCQVPVKPLIIDTWTVPEQSNYGFTLYTDDTASSIVNIEKVEVSSDCIIITSNIDLNSVPNLFVTYANLRTKGRGNIRDSYDGYSIYTYEKNDNGNSEIVHKPLDKDGNELIGKKYPLNNWLPSFGMLVQ